MNEDELKAIEMSISQEDENTVDHVDALIAEIRDLHAKSSDAKMVAATATADAALQRHRAEQAEAQVEHWKRVGLESDERAKKAEAELARLEIMNDIMSSALRLYENPGVDTDYGPRIARDALARLKEDKGLCE